MVRLTRTIRFSVNPDAPSGATGGPADLGSGVLNGFAGHPTMRGLGRHYEFRVTCAAEPDPVSGMICNVAEIDSRLRRAALPLVSAACASRAWVEPAALLASVVASSDRALEGRLASLEWRLSPTYAVEMETRDMSRALIRQRFEFAASHRLHRASLTEHQNLEAFGKCNNPAGHGHNYQIEPQVSFPIRPDGAPGPGSGESAFSLEALERIVSKTIIARFDHKHLNEDTEEFGAGGVIPTVENIVRVCFDLLAPEIERASPGARLVRVTVWETEKTSCTYPA